MQKPKLTAVEKSVRRVLFYRRLWGGLVAFFLLLLFTGLFLFGLHHRHRKVNDDAPNYDHLDESSVTYWSDRVEQDVRDIRHLELTPDQEMNRLRLRLRGTLAVAAATPAGFARNVAVSDTAFAIFRHDIAVDIDEFLEAMGETPLAAAMRAKILVSEALLRLRLNDQGAASVAINGYERMLTHYDVKLDSEPAELAFIGAVKYYRYTFGNEALDTLFQKNLKFASRISDSDLRMKAYRIIATEQSRAERDRDAMETTLHINSHLELVRAFQAIIINVSRPTKPDLTDPQAFQPPTGGPWEPPNPKFAKRIINDVLNAIASQEDVDVQIDLLKRLAGSAMVCDPDLLALLKGCLIESGKIRENVKRPIIRLLEEPESPTIRKSNNRPPLADKKGVDTAIDDFATSTNAVNDEDDAADPVFFKGVVDLERIKVQLFIVRSYLAVNRRLDAALCLQQAFKIAEALPDVRDRIDLLLDIAGLQLNAGDFAGSRQTFKTIGLPQQIDGILTWEIPSNDVSAVPIPRGGSMEMSLSRLVHLKVLARHLDDAESAVNLLPSGDTKDEECAFLAAELIRIQRLHEAGRVIGNMRTTPLQTELSHRLAIARGGSEASYRALDIPFPEKTQREEELERAALLLIQFGLYDAAQNAVGRLLNVDRRAALSVRIVRHLIPFITSYYGEDVDHSAVRKTLIDLAFRTANAIESPQEQTEAVELIFSALVPLVKGRPEQEALQPLIDQALTVAGEIPSTELTKVGMVARLLSAKVQLHAMLSNRSTTWPLLDQELDKQMIDDIRKQLSEAAAELGALEPSSETAVARELLAIARVNGQIGRTQRVRQILDSVLETAKTTADKRESVFLYLSTVPLFRALGDDEAAKAVYYDAFGAVGSVPNDDPTFGNAGMLFGERLRDGEIDNLVRSLLENDFMYEAILFAERLTDDTMRDRMLRIAAFRLIDKEDFAAAENTANKLSDPELKDSLLRNILLVKRQK